MVNVWGGPKESHDAWYRLWLDKGDRQYLDDSVLYNEDDCRATRLITDWMATEAAEKRE